jgi:hypothetical protein
MAHDIGHWNRYGNPVYFYIYDTTEYTPTLITAARDARIEWDNDTILNFGITNYHTDVSLYDATDTRNVFGLAEFLSRDAHGHYTHVHAWYNERYWNEPAANIRGVFCEELGHAWGLDHSDPTHGCMGNLNTVEQHNIDDIRTKYYGTHRIH